MIINIQLIRGLAALGVVFYHTHFWSQWTYSTKFYGVEIFFILSGFIICLVTQENTEHYAVKRFIRVAPMYWIATLMFAFAAAFGVFNPLYVIPTWIDLAAQGHLAGWFSAQAAATLTPDYWAYIAQSMSLLPMDRPPILGVGWTLVHEVFFYTVYGCGLLYSRRFAPVLAAFGLILTTVIAYIFQDYHETALITYGSDVNFHFFQGILIFYAWKHSKEIRIPGRLALVTSWAVGVGWIFISLCLPSSVLFQFTLAPAVVAAALVAEKAGFVTHNRFLLLLGNASYSIYLTHLAVIEPFRAIAQQVPWFDQARSFPVMCIAMGTSIALGIAVHLCVEKPMLRAMHRRLPIRKNLNAARSAERPLPKGGI